MAYNIMMNRLNQKLLVNKKGITGLDKVVGVYYIKLKYIKFKPINIENDQKIRKKRRSLSQHVGKTGAGIFDFWQADV